MLSSYTTTQWLFRFQLTNNPGPNQECGLVLNATNIQKLQNAIDMPLTYQPTLVIAGFVQTGFERKLQQETDEKIVAARRRKRERDWARRQRKLQHIRAQQYLLCYECKLQL